MPYPTVLRENTWATTSGWGNGYVRLPETHPYYGADYNDIPVEVHGGLTFGEHLSKCPIFNSGFWVGFDTMHNIETRTSWPKERVQAETENLRIQLEALAKPEPIERIVPTQFYSVLPPGTKIESTDVYCLPLERWLRPVEVFLATKEQ